MNQSRFILLASGLLAASAWLGAAAPTAAMFQGNVTVAEGGGLSLQERSAEIFRQLARQKEGTSFFTAWAFPTFERIHSCERDHAAGEKGPLSIQSRNGRIVVDAGGDHGLDLSADSSPQSVGASWAVLVFLNRVENGRCRASDMTLLAPDRGCKLGGERLFWLGAADEAQGLEFIRGLLRQDSDRDLRKHLVFALYMFSGPGGGSELIGLARHDPDAAVRKDAIFWLGQKASAAAIRALGEVIASPEALEIKKHAVFALSQLPVEKGTPLLLEIARKNPSPALRKTAIFWLGESGDPRALEFFEEILLK